MKLPFVGQGVTSASLNAMAWMSGALFSFCFMAIGARELSHGINTFEVLLGRSIVCLVGSVALIMGSRQWGLYKTQNLHFHLARNGFQYLGQYGWFLGVSLLQLTQVFAIEFTSPLWTTLLAAIFLAETLTIKRVFAVILGFAGVYIIVNPGQGMINANALYVLGAAVCFSCGNIFTKKLVKTDNPLTILFFMSLVQLPIGVALSFSSGDLGLFAPAPDHNGWRFDLRGGISPHHGAGLHHGAERQPHQCGSPRKIHCPLKIALLEGPSPLTNWSKCRS